MSYETTHQFRDPTVGLPLFAELSVVETLRPVDTDDGRPVPPGSRGTVVAVYGDGAAYEVEFTHPVVGNATMRAEALRAA